MAGSLGRHQNRHFKTLILLVLSMTGGTFFLLWLGQLSPVTPLRSRTAADWNQIAVRTDSADTPQGFYHLRIDVNGQVFQSDAWKEGRAQAGRPGIINLVLSTSEPGAAATRVQAQTLQRTLADLTRRFGIAQDRIVVLRDWTPSSGIQLAGS